MRSVRVVALLIAITSVLLLFLVALNLTQTSFLHLKRFREVTWVFYAALAIFALARSDRAAFANAWVSRIGAAFEHRRFFPIAAGSMLFFYLLAALTQHLSFHTFSHDFSMIDQALVPHAGRPPLYSPVLGRSFLSEHFSPILFPLVWLHQGFSSPYFLVVLQPLALWAATFPLRGILLEGGASAAVANLACVVFWNNPIQIATLSYLFHMECFLPLFVFAAFRFYQRGEWPHYVAMLLLALAVKEDVAVYLIGLAAYATVIDRKWVAGIATALACLAWIAFVHTVGMPRWGGMEEGYRFFERWRAWGNGPWGILAGFATRPFDLTAALLALPYLKFFALLMFLPLFRPSAILLFVAAWIVPATSGLAQQRHLGLYYGLPLLVFASLAAAIGLASPRFRKLAAWRFAPVLAIMAIVGNVAHLSYPEIPRTRQAVLRALGTVPADATVEAMSCFFPVLGYTRSLSLIRDERELSAEFAVLRADGTSWPLASGGARRIVAREVETGSYRETSRVEGIHILRRVATASGQHSPNPGMIDHDPAP